MAALQILEPAPPDVSAGLATFPDLPFQHVAIRRPTLDDVFLAITAQAAEPAADAHLIGTKG